MRASASININLGMVSIPCKIAKADSDDDVELTSLCECGGGLSYTDDPVECDVCGDRYGWWNQVPNKGFDLGGETVVLDPDEVDAAREETPVETGSVEAVAPVKTVLKEYNVTGNYYVFPEDGFEDQYGVLVQVLDDHDWAICVYGEMRSKTKRYALVSEDGVLMGLELSDKRDPPEVEYDADEMMVQQAEQMLEGMASDEVDLENVERQALRDLINDHVDGFDGDGEEAEIDDLRDSS